MKKASNRKLWQNNIRQPGYHFTKAMILTRQHIFWDASFNGFITPVTTFEEGVWICSKAIILPGTIRCKSHSILTAGSVINKEMKEYTIYAGNPAKAAGERVII